MDELSEVAESEGVQAMPTFKFFKNGAKCCDDVVGGNAAKLEAVLASFWRIQLYIFDLRKNNLIYYHSIITQILWYDHWF